MALTVLITGGSGFIGQQLTEALLAKGYTIHLLNRSATSNTNKHVKTFRWDVYKKQIDPACIHQVDAIIHLAGEAIANERWTHKRKKQLIESRTQSIRLIYSLLKADKHHTVKTVVSASAIGYYGSSADKLFTETDKPSNQFLGKLCLAWEQTVSEGKSLGIRVVHLRTGLVLARNGGVLSPMIKLTQWNLSSPMGKGDQWMSWMHIVDAVNM